MHVRLQSWFRSIQVCINGREWLTQKMKRVGLGSAAAVVAPH